MRLFVGIPLPEAVEAELSAVCRRMQSGSGGLRWAAPESWHITLQFLGNATAEQFDCLKARLAQVRAAPAAVRLGSLGVFDRAGVFFVEVEAGASLVALQERVTAATAGCGFVAEAGKGALKALKTHLQNQSKFAAFTADEFLLYESHLGPGGSKYEVRQRVRLGAV